MLDAITLREAVSDHEDGKHAVPHLIKPGARLRAGIEQTLRGKQAREGQSVHGGRDAGEQVCGCKQKQRAGAQRAELNVKQHRGHHMREGERRLMAGNEYRDLPQGKFRERRQGAEEDGRSHNHCHGETTIPRPDPQLG